MTEVIANVEVKAKSKKGPQGPIKQYVIIGAELGVFEMLEEYCERTGAAKEDLRAALNLAFATDARKSIRVPFDHPALVLEAKAKRDHTQRYLFIFADGTAAYSSKTPESYISVIDLKNKTMTNSVGTLALPWEKGEFHGTRPVSKKDKPVEVTPA
jgi:hypothetical protein